MLWLLAASLSGAIAAPAPHSAVDIGALLSSPTRRVRTTNGRVAALITEGLRRSSTFRALVLAINASDVIVYIEATRNLPSTIDGRLMLLPLANQQRYLRIQIRAFGDPRDLIALMGHELRHALEVAAEPRARDEASLIALYTRIGSSGIGMHSFETTAAQVTARVVRQELAG
jgi:hypothetical protein